MRGKSERQTGDREEREACARVCVCVCTCACVHVRVYECVCVCVCVCVSSPYLQHTLCVGMFARACVCVCVYACVCVCVSVHMTSRWHLNLVGRAVKLLLPTYHKSHDRAPYWKAPSAFSILEERRVIGRKRTRWEARVIRTERERELMCILEYLRLDLLCPSSTIASL